MNYKTVAKKIIKRLEEQGAEVGNKNAVYKVCKTISEEQSDDNLKEFVDSFFEGNELGFKFVVEKK